MPFNREGEWVTLDPLETYRDFVKKADTNRGGAGASWNAATRNGLHDAATRFVMERDNIAFTEENFYLTREQISRELETHYDHDERNGFLPRTLLPETPSSGYDKIGD